MNHPPLDESIPVPRAATYGRGNQATGRYGPLRPVSYDLAGTTEARPPARWGHNSRRGWLFPLALVLTLGLAAAVTTSALVARPGPAALAPDDVAPWTRPPAEPTPVPPTVGQPRPPAWDSVVSRPAPPGRTRTAPAAGPGAAGPGAAGPGAAGPGAAGPGAGRPSQPVTPVRGMSYKNCGQARKAGAAPLLATDPGYSVELDKDGDGVACEQDANK